MTEHKPGCNYKDCEPCSCGASITEQPGVPVLAANSEGKLLNEKELRALDEHIKQNYKPEQPECETCDGARNVGGSGYLDEQGNYIETETVDCPDCKPNTNAMIVKTIQGLMTVVNNNLSKLDEETQMLSCHRNALVRKALEEIDLFEKTTLFDLQKAFK
ncbi:MAG TPA: hypothetical protein ENH82_11165 [bacterium]|nr:hypothetical protein [bacterium]